MNKNSIHYTIMFSFIITFILIFILSLSHQYTREKVNTHKQTALKKAVLKAFNYTIADEDDINKIFVSRVNLIKKEKQIIYITNIENQKIYAHLFTGSGLWGTIIGIISVNKDVTKIYGLEILSHNETPGLGARIEEEWFLKQFRNEKINNLKISIDNKGTGKGDYNSDNSRIDAITGATQTTTFLESIINSDLKKFKNVLEKLNEQ